MAKGGLDGGRREEAERVEEAGGLEPLPDVGLVPAPRDGGGGLLCGFDGGEEDAVRPQEFGLSGGSVAAGEVLQDVVVEARGEPVAIDRGRGDGSGGESEEGREDDVRVEAVAGPVGEGGRDAATGVEAFAVAVDPDFGRAALGQVRKELQGLPLGWAAELVEVGE